MKKSLSTKILALFMAVLMLITAIPFTALAFDYDYNDKDTASSQLAGAINEYETELMVNHKILKNMEAAYKAYVEARKVYDEYTYGGKTTASKLTDAYNNLNQYLGGKYATLPAVFTDESQTAPEGAIKANWTVKWSNSNSYDDYFSQQYSNKILWAETYTPYNEGQCHMNANYGSGSAYNGADFYVSYGKTVLLYDGEGSAPRFPAMATAKRWGTGWNNYDVKLGGCGPTDSRFSTMKNYTQNGGEWPIDNAFATATTGWTGAYEISTPTDAHFGWGVYSYDGADFKETDDNISRAWGYIYGTPEDTDRIVLDDKNDFADNETIPKLFSSSIAYTSDRLDENVLGLGIPFEFSVNTCKLTGGYKWKHGSATSTVKTYYINYAKVKAAAEAVKGFDAVQNVQYYTQDDYSNVCILMSLIDRAYNFNPDDAHLKYSENFDKAITDVTNEINDITGVYNYQELNRDGYQDPYDALRTAVAAAEKKVADKGLTAENVTTGSEWANFTALLNQAHGEFAYNELWNGVAAGLVTNLEAATAKLEKKADYTDYNKGLDELKATIASGKYTEASLKQLAEAINDTASSFYAKDHNNVGESQHDAMMAQIETFKSILKEVDLSAFDSAADELKASVENTDKYNTAQLEKLLNNLKDTIEATAEVDIAGTPCMGYTQQAIDTAVAKIKTQLNLSQWPYTVTIDGKTLKDDEGNDKIFHWGDSVSIEAKPYTLSVIAGETQQAITKYIDKMDELTVRGNMTLTSCDKEAGESGVIKVVGNTNGHVYYVDALEAGTEVVLAELNVVAPSFYKLVNFTVNGEVVTTVTAKAGETIVVNANFAAIEGEGVFGVSYNGGEAENCKYNQYKKFDGEAEGVIGYKSSTGELLCEGPVYEFYVAEAIDIIPIMSEDEMPENAKKSYAIAKPNVSGNNITFVGSYLNTIDTKSVVTQGIIVDFLGGHKDELKLADVSHTNYVYDYSITSADEDTHQYGLLLKGVPKRTINYVAYVKYMEDGEEKTEYSNVRTAEFGTTPSTVA